MARTPTDGRLPDKNEGEKFIENVKFLIRSYFPTATLECLANGEYIVQLNLENHPDKPNVLRPIKEE